MTREVVGPEVGLGFDHNVATRSAGGIRNHEPLPQQIPGHAIGWAIVEGFGKDTAAGHPHVVAARIPIPQRFDDRPSKSADASPFGRLPLAPDHNLL